MVDDVRRATITIYSELTVNFVGCTDFSTQKKIQHRNIIF